MSSWPRRVAHAAPPRGVARSAASCARASPSLRRCVPSTGWRHAQGATALCACSGEFLRNPQRVARAFDRRIRKGTALEQELCDVIVPIEGGRIERPSLGRILLWSSNEAAIGSRCWSSASLPTTSPQSRESRRRGTSSARLHGCRCFPRTINARVSHEDKCQPSRDVRVKGGLKPWPD
jgi:hypothetical protein